MLPLDDFDKAILKLVQQNNRLTADELGDTIGLSASAVQRRLKKLRDEKIIEADISIVSPTIAGFDITCVVDVILVEGNALALEKFKASMRSCVNVMQCYFVTGTYDFVIIVNARDMSDYETFTRAYLMDQPNIKHFYTHVVMDKVKVDYGVTL